ncbi:glycerol-3-phosphate dehydrogenase [Acrasis kona]|uniref:Glycerol-3-phosphate dehydrogenase [NAD(+)] n=1 Tax=Acrasis kona TaxID=1008807 RepID=A0AAW2YGL6_9EUKA
MTKEDVLVLGCGNFGTCLAYHLCSLNRSVRIWARDAAVVESINTHHKNPKYLKDTVLPDNLTGVGPEFNKEMFDSATVILLCIPTQHLRSILEKIKSFIKEEHLLIMANKGIEISTLQFPFEIAKEVLGETIGNNSAFLSGPSFAVEVVQNGLTCVSVASHNSERAKWAQKCFHTKIFRAYTTKDVVGVELAGSIKNVLAIASGVAGGLDYQSNAKAALFTRGASEMVRLGAKIGCDPITMLTLAGIGDLFLTCTSEKSRNYTVGYRLGKGEKLKEIVSSLGSVAEGVPTAKAAHDLCEKHNIKLPIMEGVYQILYEDRDARRTFRSGAPW